MSRRTYRAVIFDLDGVLWDGEPLYREAFNVVLAPYGHRLTETDYMRIIGQTVEACWEWVRDKFSLSVSPGRCYHLYNDAVLHLLDQPIEPLPGVRPLLQELRRRGTPAAVASSSLRAWVDATLRGLGIEDCFQATVSVSEVDRGKPAPDLYLTAAQRLNVPPAACIAVEDTAPGIAAARAAGMLAVQLRASSTALPPLPEADLVLSAYSEFDLSLLNGARA